MKTIRLNILCLTTLFAATSLCAANTLFTFNQISDLSGISDHEIAIQTGSAGGIWVRQSGQAESNGGTVISGGDDFHWRRQCDPGRLDARWFGVRADGVHDDAPALQAAIDALPPEGGKLLLPVGRMLCKKSLTINRSFITIEGANCGLLSKHFEPSHEVGKGSLLFFEGCDGIVIQGPPVLENQKRPDRLGGITLREFGISGTGRQAGQTGILVLVSENQGWGSTDALRLERIYCIELTWSADLHTADMTVVTGCWFTECGNGLRLKGSIYTLITDNCFADNDGFGVMIEGGKGSGLVNNVFVRNKVGLLVQGPSNTRVTNSTFEVDPPGGVREYETLIKSINSKGLLLTGCSFKNGMKKVMDAAIIHKGKTPTMAGCSFFGNFSNEIAATDE